MIKTNFLGGEAAREDVYYTCIAYWFCYENGKKELSPGLFRRIQYKINKAQMLDFINTELELDSELESNSEWL